MNESIRSECKVPEVCHRNRRAWRISLITPLGELLSPSRIVGTAVRLASQIFLVVCLWRALYVNASSSAGLNREQAITYAVLAILLSTIRNLDRSAARDTVFQHVQQGSIVYWFLRPLPPHRYYLLRAIGDQLYGFIWALVGYLVLLASGVVELPESASSAVLFTVSMLLGQVILYYLQLTIDLICFWTVMNQAAMLILKFAQNILSGTFAPLWFFPGWFIVASSFLPFQGTVNVPLSIYIGRIPLDEAPRELIVQALWCILFAGASRLIWRRVAERVISQGG